MSTNRSLCPQCGWDVAVDEDGCCVVCGALALGAGVDAAAQEIARLRADLADNAAMLAHQCDLAREAEIVASGLRIEIARLTACVGARDRAAVRPSTAAHKVMACAYCGLWGSSQPAPHRDDCPTITHPVKP